MNIEKCSIVIKCDVDGCHNKADRGIVFDGVRPQYFLCDKCLKKLYETLKKQFEGEDENAKGSKK
ncbi:MAG: hypothetical protein IKA61_04915 [Clostridia bacterium]|nr:hypothetical protein [Clostridia bacterium]